MISRTSADWLSTRRWLQAEIARLSEELIATYAVAESDRIRGEIRFARKFIAAVEPEAVETPGPPAAVPGAGF